MSTVRRRGLSKTARRTLLVALAFQALWGIGFIVFLLYPMVATMYFSLTDFQIMGSPHYIGLSNYQGLFSDNFFWLALGNTAYVTLIGVPLSTAFAFITAMLLNTRIRGMALWRTLYFLPSIMPSLAAALLWLWIFNPQFGAVNSVLAALHLPQPGWMTSPVWSKPSLILLSLWQIGVSTVIYLAALQSVPQTLYEAVRIDGGGWWASLRHVTIPLVSPVTLFIVITGLINMLQIFAQPFIIGGSNGMPQGTLLFYVMYIYMNAFQYFHMGYASALSWILFLFIMACTAMLIWGSRRWVHYESGNL